MKSESQEIVREIFEFLKSDFDFQRPVESNIAYERHLTFSNDKFQIDFSDEGDWSFPSITIKHNKKNFVPLPAVWFKPAGLQHEIATDYRKPRNLRWLSKVDQKTLDCSSYPLTQEIIENVDDSFQARGQKIIAIYLLVTANALKSNMNEIPSLFENPIFDS